MQSLETLLAKVAVILGYVAETLIEQAAYPPGVTSRRFKWDFMHYGLT